MDPKELKALTAIAKEIAALRGSIDRLTKKLGAHCIPVKNSIDWDEAAAAYDMAEEEAEVDNPDDEGD